VPAPRPGLRGRQATHPVRVEDGFLAVVAHLTDLLGSGHHVPSDRPQACRGFLEALRSSDRARYATILGALVDRLAVWLPADVYERAPVLLPHVMRDNRCRKEACPAGHRKARKGRVGEPRDMWSTPTAGGYVRDDNSLVKNLVSDGTVVSGVGGAVRLGPSYVACHVWAMATVPDPWLNSFVPNLVWLPRPLDVLSDQDEVMQALLRARARGRFARALVHPSLTSELWASLPAGESAEQPPNQGREFDLDQRWLANRLAKIVRMADLLGALVAGRPAGSSGHSHYDQHLVELGSAQVQPLATRLAQYVVDLG